MEAIRILKGNTIPVVLYIYRDGAEEQLTGKQVSLSMLQKPYEPEAIEAAIAGNKASFSFGKKHQYYLGKKSLLLCVEKTGEQYSILADNVIDLVSLRNYDKFDCVADLRPLEILCNVVTENGGTYRVQFALADEAVADFALAQ